MYSFKHLKSGYITVFRVPTNDSKNRIITIDVGGGSHMISYSLNIKSCKFSLIFFKLIYKWDQRLILVGSIEVKSNIFIVKGFSWSLHTVCLNSPVNFYGKDFLDVLYIKCLKYSVVCVFVILEKDCQPKPVKVRVLDIRY